MHAGSDVGLKVRADGALAQASCAPSGARGDADWDAAIEEVSAAELVARATVTLNGWLGPRWLRSGWFHAYRLLGDLRSPSPRQAHVEANARSGCRTVAYDGAVERINLERELVAIARSPAAARCVAGYTVKREYFNAAFSAGIENIGFDALEGSTRRCSCAP